MKYIDVAWIHDSPEYPVRLVSEIADDGYERRKIDYYADGRVDFADETRDTGSTMLAEQPTPPLEEINSDPQFRGVAIAPEQFELLWLAATSHGA